MPWRGVEFESSVRKSTVGDKSYLGGMRKRGSTEAYLGHGKTNVIPPGELPIRPGKILIRPGEILILNTNLILIEILNLLG